MSSGSGELKSSGMVNWPLARSTGRSCEAASGAKTVSRQEASFRAFLRNMPVVKFHFNGPISHGVRLIPTQQNHFFSFAASVLIFFKYLSGSLRKSFLQLEQQNLISWPL